MILPSSSEMWEDIEMKRTAMSQRYVESTRHTIQVDYVEYMDEIAKLGGNFPDVCK